MPSSCSLRQLCIGVSIHAFRGEGDPVRVADFASGGFQSTPSGGKATYSGRRANSCAMVSIHAFRGEGDYSDTRILTARVVSIHAFRGEGDCLCGWQILPVGVFQSTPSGGKATPTSTQWLALSWGFNPRLPGGRRQPADAVSKQIVGFNPRLPGGRRPARIIYPPPFRPFQSTPSGGKATFATGWHSRECIWFQSTPSGGKATSPGSMRYQTRFGFNPRLPGGRRPTSRRGTPTSCSFNPRLPGGRRRFVPAAVCRTSRFQSTPSGGKATSRREPSFCAPRFQSTPSGGKATCAHPSSGASTPGFNPRLPGGRRHLPDGARCPRAWSFNPRLPGGRRL